MVFGGRTREAEAREKEETEEPAGCRWSGRELGRWCEEEESRSGEGKSQKREGPVRAAERRTRRPGRVGPFQQGADTRHRRSPRGKAPGRGRWLGESASRAHLRYSANGRRSL